MLLPYSGSPLSNPKFNDHVPNTTNNCCSIDTSRSVNYRYNSLGFRGEDYNQDAKFHIFLCGASEDFGAGLEEQDIWGHQFKLSFAQQKQVDPSEVNLLNFSQNGASMDYITRVLVSQCQRVKPDLVIAALPPSSRTEYFSDEKNKYFSDKAVTFNSNVYRTVVHTDTHEYFQQRTSKLDEEALEELASAIEGFYLYYTDRIGLTGRLKNILLLQQFCETENIPVLFWSLFANSLNKELNQPLPLSITALADCVNFNHIYTHPPLHPNHPKAADNLHPGAEVHRGIAHLFWKFYCDLQIKKP